MPDVLSQLLVPDPWLAEQLRRPAFRLDGDGAVDSLPKPAFVWTRVPAADGARVERLRSAGFQVVDTAVTLERSPEPVQGPAVNLTVRLAAPGDRDDVVALARRAFTWSRFHRDPAIGAELADTIKANWVDNFFCGQRGDALVVAADGRRIVGFLLALAATDGAMVIDLVAVDEAWRGRGLAAALTGTGLRQFPGATAIRVGTQVDNIAALRAYEQIGFTAGEPFHVMHLHRD